MNLGTGKPRMNLSTTRTAHLPVIRLLLVLLLLALPATRPAAAQDPLFKRAFPPAIPMVCDDNAAARVVPPPPGVAAEAERLRSSAQQATLLGDPERARTLLQRAATLDPSSAQLAYHHARILEALGQTTSAFEEYCRYLALTPESAETEEISRHAEAIAPYRSPLSFAAMTAFTTGIRHFDAGELVLAEAAFATVIAEAPEWAVPHFNRALVLLARGEPSAAAAALKRYLALAPEAGDGDDVHQLQARLSAPPPVVARRFHPALGLGTGVLFPGLGQFYTRRPAPGLVALAAAGGATYFALQTTSPVPTAAPAPRRRPYFVAGLGAAAAITLLSAIEAALYAAREEAPGTALSSHDSAPTLLASGAHFGPLALHATPGGLRADLGVRIWVR